MSSFKSQPSFENWIEILTISDTYEAEFWEAIKSQAAIHKISNVNLTIITTDKCPRSRDPIHNTSFSS